VLQKVPICITTDDYSHGGLVCLSPQQEGLTSEKQVIRGGSTYTIIIDNSWIVPYSPFLLRVQTIPIPSQRWNM
jgi:hypothetical protein